MQIADLIDEGRVLMDVQPSDKADLLRLLSKQIAGFVSIDALQIASALTTRETLGSTGMGDGIAIPHARIVGVTHPTGLFAHLKSPIDYEAIDGNPVDLVFLIVLPADPRSDQLQALACVSRCLRNPRIAAELRMKADALASFRILTASS